MRYALFFAGLSAAFTVLAMLLGPFSLGGLAGLLTALGFVGPAVAYATGRSAILGKNEAGTHAGWAQLLHGSYLGHCRLSLLFAQRRGEDAWNAVTETILLGARPTRAQARVLLDTHAVAAVLDLTCELVDPALLRTQTTYLCVPVLDRLPPTAAQLTRAVAFIEEHHTQHTVYVHCAVGRGRSSTVVAAWMLSTQRADTVDHAEQLLRKIRPTVGLSAVQKAAVQKWAQQHAS